MLCTGNQCRSPMGEAVLRDRLARRGVEAHVHSAGSMEGGRPAQPFTAKVMAKRGFDLDHHVSTRLAPPAVEGADLVIGMAREHVREAAVMAEGALRRTFTLRELVRRGEAVGPRRPSPDTPDGLEPIADWLDRAAEGRRPADLLGDDSEDDVPDPMGLSKRQHDKTAAQVIDLVDRLVALAFPEGGPRQP